jgi:hypothetical protein
MTFHRAAADPHGGGYLGLGQIGVIAQDYRLALPSRQVTQGGDDCRPLEQDEGPVLGARHVRRHILKVLLDHHPMAQHGT